MLLRELIEKRIGRLGSTSRDILVTLPNARDGIFVVFAVRLQVVGKHVVESVSRALAAPPGERLELHQAFGSHRQGVHVR